MDPSLLTPGRGRPGIPREFEPDTGVRGRSDAPEPPNDEGFVHVTFEKFPFRTQKMVSFAKSQLTSVNIWCPRVIYEQRIDETQTFDTSGSYLWVGLPHTMSRPDLSTDGEDVEPPRGRSSGLSDSYRPRPFLRVGSVRFERYYCRG